MRYIITLVFAAVAFSCIRNTENKVSFYYDTDSLMQEQKKILNEKQASIKKRAVVNGDTSNATVVPDSLQAWDNEFNIFGKININKPALRGVYEVKEYDDTRSNLKIREYSTTEKDVEVPLLRLYYLKTPENLRTIEAIYVEDNPIFNAERNLKFVFDDFTGRTLLHEYSITGTQKMILKDCVRFEIKAEIQF